MSKSARYGGIKWVYLSCLIVYFGTTKFRVEYDHSNGNIFHQKTGFPFCVASETIEESEIPASATIRTRGTTLLTKSISDIGDKPTGMPFVPTTTMKTQKATLNQILYRAGKRGLGGGIPGAIAGAVQVLSLMWLRTIINYQCRYGTTFVQALRTLLNDGGIARLYCGVTFALVQAPLARFVSTAANDGVESLLANISLTKDWGPGRTTVVASIVVGFWRILLMRTLRKSFLFPLIDFFFSHKAFPYDSSCIS
jgi:hypothetical protein